MCVINHRIYVILLYAKNANNIHIEVFSLTQDLASKKLSTYVF